MAVIGALVAELSANHAEFRRDMGKAAGAVQSSSARMNRALGKVDQGFGRVKKAVGRMLKSANLLRHRGRRRGGRRHRARVLGQALDRRR